MAEENTTTETTPVVVTDAPVETVAAPVVVAPAPEVTNTLAHLSNTFNRDVTVQDMENILAWAEGRENPAIDEMLGQVDSDDPKVVNKAMETLFNVYSLAATKTPAKLSLRDRIRKTTMDSTARQAPLPEPGPGPTPAQVTESLVAEARKTGIEPTVEQVLAAHKISI